VQSILVHIFPAWIPAQTVMECTRAALFYEPIKLFTHHACDIWIDVSGWPVSTWPEQGATV